MSNRRSDYGSLANRTSAPVTRAEANQRHLPVHVWVDTNQAGLLTAWRRAAHGVWWGQVVTAGPDGKAEESWIVAARLRQA